MKNAKYLASTLLVLGLPLVQSGVAYADCSGNCAGWESVGNYNGTNPNLPKTIPEGQKFQAAINNYSSSGVTDFAWKDNAAWERDFKSSSLGGIDNLYADDVDLVLFSGHGNSSGFYFGVSQDDLQVHYNDAYLGNKDLEWLIVDACQVLKNDASKFNRWGFPVFGGLHYVLGFSSNTFDVDTRGEDFIKYAMSYGWTVRDAWINATIVSENGTTAAYMRADNGNSNTYTDHLWGFGSVSSDPSSPSTLYYLSWGT
jgi:hypothetical protein